ncbi:MAG: molybdate ABC transporter substrate-binding protein [Betaproteobacteria bacterium]
MRRRTLLTAWVSGAASALARPGLAAAADELVVFAAASLVDALQGLGKAFRQRTGQAVVFAFGGSGDLARQIRAGAPASVFVSADSLRVDELERAGLVRPADRFELLSNRLVVVVPAGSSGAPASARELTSLRRIVLADPQTVPAGAYARQWLERAGVWAALRERVVPALDVRAALAAVEAEAAPAAVVYATDASGSRRVRVAFEVPAADAPRIVYVAALLSGAGPAARQFLAYLRSPEAGAVFRRFGFTPLPAR